MSSREVGHTALYQNILADEKRQTLESFVPNREVRGNSPICGLVYLLSNGQWMSSSNAKIRGCNEMIKMIEDRTGTKASQVNLKHGNQTRGWLSRVLFTSSGREKNSMTIEIWLIVRKQSYQVSATSQGCRRKAQYKTRAVDREERWSIRAMQETSLQHWHSQIVALSSTIAGVLLFSWECDMKLLCKAEQACFDRTFGRKTVTRFQTPWFHVLCKNGGLSQWFTTF